MLLIINHHGFYEVWSKDGRGVILERAARLADAVRFCGGRRYRIAA